MVRAPRRGGRRLLDLRHPDLDAKEWRMGEVFGFSETMPCNGWPFIWFPWFGPFSEDRFWLGPEFAENGDTIRLRKVIIEEPQDKLNRDYKEIALGFVSIVKKGGEAFELDDPIVFIKRGSFDIFDNRAFETIEDRICQHFSIEKVEDRDIGGLIFDKRDLAATALSIAQRLNKTYWNRKDRSFNARNRQSLHAWIPLGAGRSGTANEAVGPVGAGVERRLIRGRAGERCPTAPAGRALAVPGEARGSENPRENSQGYRKSILRRKSAIGWGRRGCRQFPLSFAIFRTSKRTVICRSRGS